MLVVDRYLHIEHREHREQTHSTQSLTGQQGELLLTTTFTFLSLRRNRSRGLSLSVGQELTPHHSTARSTQSVVETTTPLVPVNSELCVVTHPRHNNRASSILERIHILEE